MTPQPSIHSLCSLAALHRGGAPAGEVFLAMEHLPKDQLMEIWNASFGHQDREDAVVVEHACASRWADLDLPGMANSVIRESRSAESVVELAAAMLNRMPHKEAWNVLNEAPEAARAVYLSVLAQSEPLLALSLLPPLGRGCFGGAARDNVLKAATRADASLTMSWLKHKQIGGSDAQAIAEELAATDPSLALEVVRWLSEESQDYEADKAAASIFDRWALSDPIAAGTALVQWLGGTDQRTPVTSWYTGYEFTSVAGRVFHRWSEADAPRALEAAMKIAPEHIRHVALNSIGIGWASAEDGLCAARALPLADRLAFMELLAPRLGAAAPGLLRQELERMSPPENSAAAGAIHAMYEHLGEDEAQSFQEKYPQWFKEGVPGFGTLGASISRLVSAITASLDSGEKLEASLTRVRKIVEENQP